MIHIVKQQEDVIFKFKSQAKEILDLLHTRDNTKNLKEKGEGTSSAELSPQATAFEKRAASLLADVALQIKELEGLKKSAESTAQSVRTVS